MKIRTQWSVEGKIEGAIATTGSSPPRISFPLGNFPLETQLPVENSSAIRESARSGARENDDALGVLRGAAAPLLRHVGAPAAHGDRGGAGASTRRRRAEAATATADAPRFDGPLAFPLGD